MHPQSGILLPCWINGVPFDIDPDSGSELTIINKPQFKLLCERLGVKPKLKSVNKRVFAINRTKVNFMGYFTAKLASKSTSKYEDIWVMNDDYNQPPIISEDALLELGYIKYCPQGSFVVRVVNADDSVPVPDLSESELQSEVKKLHEQFKKVFSGVGCYRDFEVELRLKPDSTPFILRSSQCPIHLRKQALERLKYNVQMGIMEPLPNGYAIKYCSPMLVIMKPNKKEIRLVVNFKELNKRLYRTRHVPAVGLEEFIRVCRGHAYWFRLDLRHAYHQLKLSKESQDLCIISTFAGCYRFKRLPMGLVSSQDYFDHCIETALASCTNTVTVRDDILGGGPTRRAMLEEYAKVLQALAAVGLTCDDSKTKVGLEEVCFFGMLFTKDGMRPDPAKVAALKNAPRPVCHTSLNSFNCTIAWNDTYLFRFAELVRPLRDLAKSKGSYDWTPTHEKAFQSLKDNLCNDCLNNYFREDRETVIFCDAGKTSFDENNKGGGFSAILAQIDENTGSFLPIHFASRSISPTEAKWSQVELESRAIRYALDKWRFYLTGLIHFTVYTDCKALVPLFTKMPQSCPPRIFRQILALQDLSFTVEFRPGKANPADWTSRVPLHDPEELRDMEISDDLDQCLVRSIFFNSGEEVDEQVPIAIADIKDRTAKELSFLKDRIIRNDWSNHKKDVRIKAYMGIHYELSELDGLILRGSQTIVLPESLYTKATKLVHTLSHQGMTNCEKLLLDHFWFPGYSNYVKAEVESCETCKNITQSKRKEPLGLTPAPSRCFEYLSVDFKGPFRDGRYALVFLDLYSRWPEVYFVTSTSFKAVKKFFLDLFCRFGMPNAIKSDNGPPFNGQPFKLWLKSLGIHHHDIIPETPWANEVESFMKVIGKIIELAERSGRNVDELIRIMLMAKRATPHPAIQMSPHEAVTGRRLNPGLTAGKHPVNPKSGLSDEQQLQLQKDLLASKVKTKLRHDAQRGVSPLVLRPGDRVLVRLGNKKLPEKDPYIVVKVYGKEITARNVNTGKVVRRHIGRFTLLPQFARQNPLMDDDEEEDESRQPAPLNPVGPQTDRDDDSFATASEDEDEDGNDDQPPAPGGGANPRPQPPVGAQGQPPADDRNGIPQQQQTPQRQRQQQQLPQVYQPPISPQQQMQRQQQRLQRDRIHFNPQVDVREVPRHYDQDGRINTRSSGVPPAELPNVMPTALENSAQARARAREALDQNQQDYQDQLRRDPPQ